MKRLGVIVALVFGTVAGYAQSQASSLLWEISGNELKPSYIFGTAHIMCKTDFQLSDVLKNKLTASQQFYGEIALDDGFSGQMKMARQMMMTDKTLSGMMSEADYKKASASFQQITGMPLQMFNNAKPLMALSMVLANSISCADKIQPESEFAALAKASNIPVLGLETVEFQFNLLNSQPIDSQINELKNILLNFDSAKTVLHQLLTVYKKRNIDSIYAFMKSEGKTDFENELIIKRNHNWIPLIEKAIADKPSFFAVGAGHLGGNEGVIALLRKRGFTLTPLSY